MAATDASSDSEPERPSREPGRSTMGSATARPSTNSSDPWFDRGGRRQGCDIRDEPPAGEARQEHDRRSYGRVRRRAAPARQMRSAPCSGTSAAVTNTS